MNSYKLIAVVFAVMLASCGSNSTNVTSNQQASTSTSIPNSDHVLIITLENHSYEQVIGNPDMPYFNELASQYGLTDQYYADIHQTLKDLMLITAGATVVTFDNVLITFDVDNIVRELEKDRRTWKVYASKMPSVGYLGDDTGLYMKHHNPISYFTDVQGPLRQNMVPFTPFFSQDIANGTLPNYSYIVPDLNEDAHNGTLAQADAWLSENVPQILQSPDFQRDGMLFIIWDEGNTNPLDFRGGGGRVANIFIGPHVKRGFASPVTHEHLDFLATVCAALRLTACPGGGATGKPMSEFFQ